MNSSTAKARGATAPSEQQDVKGEASRGRDDIEVKDVSVAYSTATGGQHVAVRDISLSIPGGRFLTVVGPSGTGKTSLLMVLAGLVKPTSGSVEIGGSRLSGPRPDATSIVFQDSSLLPWRTVLRNVTLPLEVSRTGKIPRAEQAKRAKDALGLVGLHEFASRYPGELSGGMKQRVALARSLVTEPSLLLMDEPFAALDEQSRYEMGEELLRVWDRLKITVVFITHSLSEAVFLGDEVVALCGTPGLVRDRFDVPFERPRELTVMADPVFGNLRGRLYDCIRLEKDLLP
jgi:NitT/TauT family transport system ATP-binding protein